MSTDTVRIRFNPLDPAFRHDPYETYARLRRDAPYLRTLGTLVLTRYADVLPALKDRRLSVDLIPATVVRTARKLEAGDIAQLEKFIRNSIVFTDNPEHVRLRRLINQAYTLPILERLRGTIANEVGHLLDQAARAGDVEAIADIAAPLPLNVLCAWMGVPRELRAEIGRHIHVIRFLLDPGMMSKTYYVEAMGSLAELTDFFVAHLRETLRRGGHNLVTVLAAARSDGDRLSETEVAFACIMAFVAGNETTQCLIGNTLDALLRFPAEMEALRAGPTLLAGAIEESIRYETPLQMTKRIAPQALVINGQAIREGEQILLCMGAANRDPEAFADPDAFRIRRGGIGHVGFGSGMHACLGGALARMQAETCVSALLQRFGHIARLDEHRRWQSHSLILRGLDTLPLRLRPQAGAAVERAA